jgi:hypothetical protein
MNFTWDFFGAGSNIEKLYNLEAKEVDSSHYPDLSFSEFNNPVGSKTELVLKFLVLGDMKNNGDKQLLGGIWFSSPKGYFVDGESVIFDPSK